MGYYFNLEKMGISKLREYMMRTELFPSHKLLLDNLEEKLDIIVSQGIDNTFQLKKSLKTKKNIAEFAEKTDIEVDYLTVLRRFINGLQIKPLDLAGFSIIDNSLLKKLLASGIKNTEQLYKQIEDFDDKMIFKKSFYIDDRTLELIAGIADISRLRYVGHSYAMILIEAGYDSIEKIKSADLMELHKLLTAVNNKRKYVKTNISLKDMKFLIEDEIYPGSALEKE